MELVILIALGIVLGFLILANLESVLALSVVLVLVALGIVIAAGLVMYVSSNPAVLIVIPGASLIALAIWTQQRRTKRRSAEFQAMRESTSISRVAPWLKDIGNVVIHDYEKRFSGHPYVVQMALSGGWVTLDGAGSVAIAERKKELIQEQMREFAMVEQGSSRIGELRIVANPLEP
jgi:hypothetical protein